MSRHDLTQKLLAALSDVPIMDAHTHLVGGKLSARGLHDVVLYHMAVSDLYAAGCPSGARLTEYPGWPDEEEAARRMGEAIPCLDAVRNTSISWGVRVILADLYDWREPVTKANWRELDGRIRERTDDRAWHREILQRSGVRATCTEFARREGGLDDETLNYALEWAFFTRCQWGEFDTALCELERCWGQSPESPRPIGAGPRPKTEREVRTLDDVHAAVGRYVGAIPFDHLAAITTHISTDLDLTPPTDDEMRAALANRDSAGPRERDVYAAYINEAYLSKLEGLDNPVPFQFSYAAEPLPYETSSRVTQESIAQLAQMVGRHPGIRFQCFLASQHANQSLCTLCRELPNLALVGYWWHNFFPSIIRRIMEERLDMLPVNRQIGFFSDAYCADWVYAKVLLVRGQLAEVLAGRIEQGQYSFDDATSIARSILHDTPRDLLGLAPIGTNSSET